MFDTKQDALGDKILEAKADFDAHIFERSAYLTHEHRLELWHTFLRVWRVDLQKWSQMRAGYADDVLPPPQRTSDKRGKLAAVLQRQQQTPADTGAQERGQS